MIPPSSLLFFFLRREQVVKNISNCDYNFDDSVWSNISDEAKKFISSCIQIDPSHRPRAEVALRADFLTKRPHHNFNMHTMKKVQESLVAYAQCNKLKQLALMVIAHKSSMDEVTKLRQVFSKYDSDKDGIISLTEFKTALADSNFTEEDIDTIFLKLVRFFIYSCCSFCNASVTLNYLFMSLTTITIRMLITTVA
jgi:serine/threonine protein kinase